MFLIKKLDRFDVLEVQKFLYKIIIDDFGYEINDKWHRDIKNLENIYINSENIFLVAFNEKKEIIGTIASRPYNHNFVDIDKYFYNVKTYGIYRHFVLKELRNRKIGTTLLNKLENELKLKKVKKIYLHTHKTIPGSLEYWISKKYKIIWNQNDNLETVHLQKILSIDS